MNAGVRDEAGDMQTPASGQVIAIIPAQSKRIYMISMVALTVAMFGCDITGVIVFALSIKVGLAINILRLIIQLLAYIVVTRVWDIKWIVRTYITSVSIEIVVATAITGMYFTQNSRTIIIIFCVFQAVLDAVVYIGVIIIFYFT